MFFLGRAIGNKVDFKDWWKELPAFSMIILICTIVSTLVSITNPFKTIIFTLIPSITFKLHLLFQLFTFPYICLDQISCLFSLLAYMPYCISKEKSQGSFKTFLNFTIQNLIIGLLFWVFSNLILILGGNPFSYFFMILFGLWPSIMYEIVLESGLNGEDQVSFIFLSFTFKKKWYPLVFLIFYSMFGAFYDLLVGLMLGYMDLFKMLEWTKCSDDFAGKWEKRLCCLALKTKRFLRLAGDNLGKSGMEFVPFNGSGHRLGTDQDEIEVVSRE